MGTLYKILGQAAPAALANTTLYTVPNGANTIISTITICNLIGSNTNYWVSFVPRNGIQNANSFIAHSVSLPAQDTIALTLGVTMGAGDSCNVSSLSGSVSFNLYGSEVT